jgi:hypothetical protein
MLAFTGCEKVNPVKKWTVTYLVYRKSNEAISYRVKYITHSGATEYKGPFTDGNFKSNEFTEFEDGSYQFLAVEVISGKGELQLQIKVNGSVYEEGTKGEFEQNFEIESNL